MKPAWFTAFIAFTAAIATAVIAAGIWLISPVSERASEPVGPTSKAVVETALAGRSEDDHEAEGTTSTSSETLSDAQLSEHERLHEVKVARRLIELDKEFQAATALSDSTARSETLARICFHWAEHDPRGAVARARALRLEENGVLENLTQQWAGANMHAARQWVDGLPTSETKERLAVRIAYLLAQSAPESAADYILASMPAGERQTEAAIPVLHQWAQRDRTAAAAWAQQFPAGELRDRAVHEITPDGLGTR